MATKHRLQSMAITATTLSVMAVLYIALIAWFATGPNALAGPSTFEKDLPIYLLFVAGVVQVVLSAISIRYRNTYLIYILFTMTILELGYFITGTSFSFHK